jgi:transposase-like protein
MFSPPFCPHADCEFHRQGPDGQRWYSRIGFYSTKAFGAVPRYRCHSCGRSFSRQTFRLDYYVKRPLDYCELTFDMNAGSGLRALGRKLGVSHHSIINRIGRLARQSVGMSAELLFEVQSIIQENFAIDGFESFVSSQYEPNNIHLLVGTESQFLYDFDYAHLRRKGRMTEAQKIERERREQQLVRRRVSISSSFANLISSLARLLCGRLPEGACLFTDEKLEYTRVLKESPFFVHLQSLELFSHRRFSSKLPRTRYNPLFAVNYLDREVRKNNANHVRETVQFSRSVNNCLERVALFQLLHNYFKPYRIDHPEKKNSRHAEIAGIARDSIERELDRLFESRLFYSHVRGKLSHSQDLLWRRAVGNVDRYDGGYSAKYVCM